MKNGERNTHVIQPLYPGGSILRAFFCCFLYRCHDASERAIRWSIVRGWPGLCGWIFGFEPSKEWDDDDDAVETDEEEGRRSNVEKETRRKRTMAVPRRMVWERSNRKAVMMVMKKEQGGKVTRKDSEVKKMRRRKKERSCARARERKSSEYTTQGRKSKQAMANRKVILTNGKWGIWTLGPFATVMILQCS